jgi:hypothetical protein
MAVCGSERREVEEQFRKASLPPSSGPHIKPEKAPDGNAESVKDAGNFNGIAFHLMNNNIRQRRKETRGAQASVCFAFPCSETL